MKKILLMMVLGVLAITGCKKDKESTEQTVMINVSYQYPTSPDLGKKTAAPTLVQLYDYSKAMNFDKQKSVASIKNSYKLTLADGTTLMPLYDSTPNFTGINTFEQVKNGKYIVIVYFKPEGYEWFMYYGYKEISVDSSKPLIMYDLVFNWGAHNEFVQL